jgi:hypothetical protein
MHLYRRNIDDALCCQYNVLRHTRSRRWDIEPNATWSWGNRMNKYDKDLLNDFSLDALGSTNIFTGGPSAYPHDVPRPSSRRPSSLYFGRMAKSPDRYMYDPESARQHAHAERGGDRL